MESQKDQSTYEQHMNQEKMMSFKQKSEYLENKVFNLEMELESRPKSLENDENVSVSTEATENQTIPSIQDESSKDDIKVPTHSRSPKTVVLKYHSY